MSRPSLRRGLLLAGTSGDGHAELIAAAPYEDAGDGAIWLFPGGPDRR
ncbi:FG-GAP repeat protein [Streptomyces sp. NPDC012510]